MAPPRLSRGMLSQDHPISDHAKLRPRDTPADTIDACSMDHCRDSDPNIHSGVNTDVGFYRRVRPHDASNTNDSHNTHSQASDAHRSSNAIKNLDLNLTSSTAQGANAYMPDDAHMLSSEHHSWSTTATCGSSPEGGATSPICQLSKSALIANQAETGSAYAFERWLEQSVQEDPWWRVDMMQNKDDAGEADEGGDLGSELDLLVRESQTKNE